MPDDLLRKEAAKWLEQAARDAIAARALLEVEPSRSVFHSQQAAEKALRSAKASNRGPKHFRNFSAAAASGASVLREFLKNLWRTSKARNLRTPCPNHAGERNTAIPADQEQINIRIAILYNFRKLFRFHRQ